MFCILMRVHDGIFVAGKNVFTNTKDAEKMQLNYRATKILHLQTILHIPLQTIIPLRTASVYINRTQITFT